MAQAEIAVPTLVLRRPGNLLGSPAEPDPVSDDHPGGVRVALPGLDYHWLGEDVDSLLAAITRFATGESRLPAPERALCAVLFTDIVGSTEHAAVPRRCPLEGSARPPRRSDRRGGGAERRDRGQDHGRRGARDVALGRSSTAGRRDDPARGSSASDLRVRMGVHVGDVERRGDDVAGIAVHVAARVMALAGPGEVLVTASVPIAVTGTDHRFELVGEQVLRGVPGTWTVFRDVHDPVRVSGGPPRYTSRGAAATAAPPSPRSAGGRW